MPTKKLVAGQQVQSAAVSGVTTVASGLANGSTAGGTGSAGSTATGGSASIPAVVGSGASKPPKQFRNTLQLLLQGVSAVLPDGSTLPQNNGGFVKAQVVAQLQAWLAPYAQGDAEAQQLATTRQQIKAAVPQAHAYVTELKAALTGFFGTGSPFLAQFGIAPRKRAAKLSSSDLAVRALKAQKTRKLRGTLGPKAKQKVKFTGAVSLVEAPPAVPDDAPPAASSTTVPPK